MGKGLVSARLENAWKARLHGRHSKFDAIRSARRHLAISASRAPEITTLTQITIASVVCVPASLLWGEFSTGRVPWTVIATDEIFVLFTDFEGPKTRRHDLPGQPGQKSRSRSVQDKEPFRLHRSNSFLAVKRGSFRFHLVFLSAELSPLQTVTRRGGDTGRRERWRDCNARSPLLQSDAGRSAECGVLQAEWVVETSLHLWRKVIFVDRSEDRIWPWVASSWRTPPLVS